MNAPANFDLRRLNHFLALGFGAGLLKPAPGTWGTLAAVPLFYLYSLANASLLVSLIVVGLGFALGVYVCGKTAEDIGVHDHGAIVWDEIVGFFVTMLWVAPSATNIALGFVLFRVFDIFKPWPIRWLDAKVHGGFGIMIDDVIAGLFAAAILILLQTWL